MITNNYELFTTEQLIAKIEYLEMQIILAQENILSLEKQTLQAHTDMRYYKKKFRNLLDEKEANDKTTDKFEKKITINTIRRGPLFCLKMVGSYIATVLFFRKRKNNYEKRNSK